MLTLDKLNHKSIIKFNSVLNANGNDLTIVVKIDTTDILKTVLKNIGEQDSKNFKSIELIITSEQPEIDSSIEKKTVEISKKEYISALLNDDVCFNGYGDAYNLVILRSNITKFFKYIYNHLFYLSSFSTSNTSNTSTSGESSKIKNEYVVSDEDELFGDSQIDKQSVNKFRSKFKTKKIDNWNSYDFLDYIKTKYKSFYGSDFLFAQDEGRGKGKAITGVKDILMIIFFEKLKLSKSDLRDYIDWLFLEKADQLPFPINMGFIVSKKVIAEWQWRMRKNKNVSNGKKLTIDF